MPREGYKVTELGELPDEWKVARLNDCADIRLSNVDKKISKDELAVLLCNYLEVYKNEYITGSMPFMAGSATREEIEKFRVLKDDVIITKDSEEFNDIAKPAYVAEEIDNLICGYHLAMLRPKDNINGLFLSKALQLHNVNIFFQNRANGITRFGISKNTIETALIPLAPLPEQHRIAEILSTLDETIEHTEALIGKYRNIKKGLMADLLTRGMDEEGRIRSEETHRFKDSPLGRIPEEWEIVKLGEYSYIKGRIGWRGLKASEYAEEGPYLIAGNHIKSPRILWDRCDHLSEFRYEESHEIKLKENDIIISKDGTIGRLGFVDYLPGKATINSTMMLIRADEKYFVPKYVFHYFEGEYFQRIIDMKMSGSSVPHIFQRDMVNLFISRPSIYEQNQIAQTLTTTDERIEKEEAYREKLLQIKKGLMQDLLTGRVRVKVPQEAEA